MPKITVRSPLATNEDTSRFMWQLMAEKNTPLINELLLLVRQHSDFGTWRTRGTLPDKAVQQICKPLREDSRFAGQPGRFYTSAEKTVQRNYEAWLASHKGKQAQLDGKRRWLKAVESDTQLAEICNASPETISAKAHEILKLISASSVSTTSTTSLEQSKKTRKSKKKQEHNSLMGELFKRFDTTDDLISRRAIIHLLKHSGKVSETEEDPEKLAQRLARKRKEIQRLEEQLQARTPKGRATTAQEAEQRLLQAISLPKHPGLMFVFSLAWTLFCNPAPSPKHELFIFTYLLKRVCQFEEARVYFEFLDWEENFAYNRVNLTRCPNPIPYPILFGAQDLVKWSRNDKGRICLSFNGLAKDHIFEVRCDRRQLPLFELFLEDWQTLKAKENKGQYSGSFLLLREATLLWQELKPKRIVKKKKKVDLLTESQDEHQAVDEPPQQADEQDMAPWKRYRLELHCTFDALSILTFSP
jgi:hypothetical protein